MRVPQKLVHYQLRYILQFSGIKFVGGHLPGHQEIVKGQWTGVHIADLDDVAGHLMEKKYNPWAARLGALSGGSRFLLHRCISCNALEVFPGKAARITVLSACRAYPRKIVTVLRRLTPENLYVTKRNLK
jgi:hypothetical protein